MKRMFLMLTLVGVLGSISAGAGLSKPSPQKSIAGPMSVASDDAILSLKQQIIEVGPNNPRPVPKPSEKLYVPNLSDAAKNNSALTNSLSSKDLQNIGLLKSSVK